MGRFSPTVREEAFDLGGVLDRLSGGYFDARYEKEERRRVKRQEQREDEEENRYLRALEAGDLALPGARTQAAHFADPNAIPYTQETLQTAGRADRDRVPLEFERPAPTEVTLPGGGTEMFQERAPYTTASGVVIDPRAARQEQNLGTILDYQLKQRLAGPQPERPITLEDQVKFAGDEAAATRAPVRPREVPKPTLQHAMDAVGSFYGRWDDKTKSYVYPFDQETLGEIIGGLTGVEFPRIEGPTPDLDPPPPDEPEEPERTIWDSIRNKFVKGQPFPKAPADTTNVTVSPPGAPAAPAPPETPSAPTRPTPGGDRIDVTVPLPAAPLDLGDVITRMRAVRKEHPDWTREQAIAELRRQDEAARRTR